MHRWWKGDEEEGGHGETDFIKLRESISAVRSKGPTPLDVYDSVVMSVIIELSGISIKRDNPVKFPDFTKGAWKKRKPYFAV